MSGGSWNGIGGRGGDLNEEMKHVFALRHELVARLKPAIVLEESEGVVFDPNAGYEPRPVTNEEKFALAEAHAVIAKLARDLDDIIARVRDLGPLFYRLDRVDSGDMSEGELYLAALEVQARLNARLK